MASPHELAQARDTFSLFATITARDEAPLYERICRGVADDPELLEVFVRIRPAQRRPNLLLAAVHDLLLAGADGELADWYPTVALYRSADPEGRAGAAERPGGAPSGDPYPAFAAFCREHRAALEERLAVRATQTNEIGRCGVLLPGLVTVSEGGRRVLFLLELGASAGLNLLFDRYHYEYVGDGRLGDPGSPVHLRSEVRQGRLPALRLPVVAGRFGVDQDPVDAGDEEAARWLLACQWPDHLDRFGRLFGALEVYRDEKEPPVVHRADMVEAVEDLAATVPGDVHLCILHTWAAAYLSPERQLDLVAALTRIGRSRPLSWLFAENAFEVPSLPLPRPPGGQSPVGGATAMVEVEMAGTVRRVRRLADVHHHGRWLHWWGPRT